MTKFKIPAPNVSLRVHKLVQKTLDTGDKVTRFSSKREKRQYKKAMGYVDIVLDKISSDKKTREEKNAEVPK